MRWLRWCLVICAPACGGPKAALDGGGFDALTADAHPDAPVMCPDGGAAGPGAWPDSPTVFCSDGVTGPVTPCPAGQDGAYRIDVPVYTAAADTVGDSITGLTWQRAAAAGLDRPAAEQGCSDLVLDGHDDWRLPAALELLSIIDYGRAGPAIDATIFPSAPGGDDLLRGAEGWVVALSEGTAFTEDAGALHDARCVRGAPPATTGLTWQVDASTATHSWLEAIATCEALDEAGHADWRLPSVKELETLAFGSSCGLAGPTQGVVWSSSPTVMGAVPPEDGAPGAWSVNLDRSTPERIFDTTLLPIRCVR